MDYIDSIQHGINIDTGASQTDSFALRSQVGFGRTQEKLGGANNGGLQAPGTGFQSGTPAFGAPSSGFGAAPGGFGSPAPSTSFAPAPSWGTTPVAAAGGFGAPATGQVVAGFGGKPAPMQPEQPQI